MEDLLLEKEKELGGKECRHRNKAEYLVNPGETQGGHTTVSWTEVTSGSFHNPNTTSKIVAGESEWTVGRERKLHSNVEQ